MEALLEKEGTMESWNDERLDELSRRMDAGFEKTATKEEMNLRFDAVDKRFNSIDAHLLQINDRLDRLSNGLLVGAFGVIAALIANMVFG
jgi:hypothetical protein